MATYPASDFPGALDSEIPTIAPGDDLDTAGKEHGALHNALRSSILAVQTALGANLANVKDARVFDVVKYGAVVNGATDDTAAWQAAIAAAGAAGGGVVTSSLNGVSVIAGALQDTGGANAQILLPSRHALDDEQISLTIMGLTEPPPIGSVVGALPVPDGHLVLKSTLGSGTGAVFGAKGPAGSFADITMVHLHLANLTVRMPSNPTNTALDLRRVATAHLSGVVVDTGSYDIDALTQPTTATSYGVRLPFADNGAHVVLDRVMAVGFYTGFEFAEHATGTHVTAMGCRTAFEFDTSNHSSAFFRTLVQHCTYGVRFAGSHYVDFWSYAVEHANSGQGWRQTTYDVDDASNYGKGFIRWSAVLAGSGPHNSFVKNSATGISSSRVGDAIGSGTDTEAVQDIIGAMVAAAGGSYNDGAGTIGLPSGSTVYTYRDRVVASAGNNVLTLGATPISNTPLVWVNGAIKWPSTDYTISGAVVTFGTALSGSDVVLVKYDSLTSGGGAASFSSVINIADNFTRANSTSALGSTSTGSLAWTQHAGTWGIDSNKAYVSSGVSGQTCKATVNAGSTAVTTVSTTMSLSSGSNAIGGIVVRSDGAGNEYVVEIGLGTSIGPVIYKGTAGSYTVLATGALTTVAVGSVVSVVLSGGSITVKDDGVTIVSATDTTWNANTRHGLYVAIGAGVSSTIRHDDFSIA